MLDDKFLTVDGKTSWLRPSMLRGKLEVLDKARIDTKPPSKEEWYKILKTGPWEAIQAVELSFVIAKIKDDLQPGDEIGTYDNIGNLAGTAGTAGYAVFRNGRTVTTYVTRRG